MEHQAKLLYTPEETMDVFTISRPTINRWVKRGILSKVSPHGARRVYITAESIQKLIKNFS